MRDGQRMRDVLQSSVEDCTISATERQERRLLLCARGLSAMLQVVAEMSRENLEIRWRALEANGRLADLGKRLPETESSRNEGRRAA